jgi:hypothetical protein
MGGETMPFLNIFEKENNIIPNSFKRTVMKVIGSKDKDFMLSLYRS